MRKKEMIKRYLLLLLGLFICTFGVAFLTKASLGTSPIASIPNCVYLIVPCFSFGTWLIIYCFILIAIQILLTRGKCSRFELLVQAVIGLTFGSCTDLSMSLLSGFAPQGYVLRLISLLIGCAILALGAALEVLAGVAMLPIDALYYVICKKVNREYAQIRVIADVTLVVISALLCLIFLGQLTAVREGTILAALLTGNIVKVFSRLIKPLDAYLH